MLVQIDIPKELNKKLKIQKVMRDNVTIADTIIEILEESLREKKCLK